MGKSIRSKLMLGGALNAFVISFSLPAMADCTNTSGDNWFCSGPTTNPQVVTGSDVNITTDSSFSVDNSDATFGAIHAENVNGFNYEQTGNGTISSFLTSAFSVSATEGSNGDINIIQNGDVLGDQLSSTVAVLTRGQNNVNMVFNGNVTAIEEAGLLVVAFGTTSGDVSITTNGDIDSNHGAILVRGLADASGQTAEISVNGDVVANKSVHMFSGGQFDLFNAAIAVELNYDSTTINIGEDAVISSLSGHSIYVPNSATTVNLLGEIAQGAVALSLFDDRFVIQSTEASISGAGSIDGGEGEDSFILDGVVGTLDTSKIAVDFINFENYLITGGSNITLNGQSLEAESFANAYVVLDTDSTLNMFGTSAIAGGLENNGRLNLSNGQTNDNLQISGDLSGTGTLIVDAALDASEDSDFIEVAGDYSANLNLIVNPTTTSGAETGQADEDGILLVDIAGEALEGSSMSLVGDSIQAGAFVYTLHQSEGDDFYLQSVDTTSVDPISVDPIQNISDAGHLAATIYYGAQSINDLIVSDHVSGQMDASDDRARAMRASNGRFNVWGRGLYQTGSQDFELSAGSQSTEASSTVDVSGAELGLEYQVSPTLAVSGALHFLEANQMTDSEWLGESLASVDLEGIGANFGVISKLRGGVYLEGKLAFTSLSLDTQTKYGGKASTDGQSWLVSAEAGKTFSVGNGLNMTPYLRFSHDEVSYDNFKDDLGNAFKSMEASRDWLTAGISQNQSLQFAGSGHIDLNSGLHLTHQFNDETKTSLQDVQTTNTYGGQTQIGASVRASYVPAGIENFNIWGEISANSGLDSDLNAKSGSIELGAGWTF